MYMHKDNPAYVECVRPNMTLFDHDAAKLKFKQQEIRGYIRVLTIVVCNCGKGFLLKYGQSQIELI